MKSDTCIQTPVTANAAGTSASLGPTKLLARYQTGKTVVDTRIAPMVLAVA
jgi:hypothetical protein